MSADSQIESNALLRLKPTSALVAKPAAISSLTGLASDVAKRLTLLMEPWGHVSPDTDKWMPDGFVAVDEAQLGISVHLIPPKINARSS